MERPRFDIVASGERMKEIRKQRNISVKQVMEYMGFESTQAVYKWEAGKCYPQADNVVALAILYNVSPMELLVEEDLVSSSSRLWGVLWREPLVARLLRCQKLQLRKTREAGYWRTI